MWWEETVGVLEWCLKATKRGLIGCCHIFDVEVGVDLLVAQLAVQELGMPWVDCPIPLRGVVANERAVASPR